tara:strand:- start:1605 stop:3161 length:1557 start_codon:yes stop_codon:yes gene_type:complete
MNNIENPIIDHLFKKISKTGYLGKYGHHLIMAILILISVGLILVYLNIQNNIKYIKANWKTMKCRPDIIPFAGIINKPPNMDSAEFTSHNFSQCTNTVLNDIALEFTAPAVNLTGSMNSAFHNLKENSTFVHKLVDKVNTAVFGIFEKIFSKITGIILPIQILFIKAKDTFKKTNGILLTMLYTIQTGYSALRKSLRAMMSVIIKWLIALTVTILAMWIGSAFFPPMAIAAVAATVFYIIVMVLLIPINISLASIFEMTKRTVPGKPGCFHKNTMINTINGNIPISKIIPGDVLKNNDIVTSTFKLSSQDIMFYSINNTIVSSKHKILHNNKWINAEDHPDAKYIYNYDDKYMYCINTSSKKIYTDGLIFSDWDELDNTDINILKKKNLIKNENDIHKNLDSAFHPSTLITLKNGTHTPIHKIKINDILKNGEKVFGIVKINFDDINNFENYHSKNNIIIGKNLKVTYNHLGNIKKYDISKSKYNKYFYHLVTDTGIFEVHSNTFYDYNASIEHILDY